MLQEQHILLCGEGWQRKGRENGEKRRLVTAESVGMEGHLAGSGGANLDRRMPVAAPTTHAADKSNRAAAETYSR